MPRWRRFSADRAAVGLVAVAVGLAAERQSYAFPEVGHWLPDLLTGWILIGCGLAARGRPGLWLSVAGFAWFAGSFSSAALLLHRGPLSQLALTFPTGRSEGRGERAVIVFAYVVAIGTAFRLTNAGTAVLAVVLVGCAVHGYRTSSGRRRRERLYALRASSALAALLSVLVVLDLAVKTSQGRNATLLGYEVALAVFAISLVLTLSQAPWERPGVADLVVELGEGRAPTLRDALARALGDPSLELGYRVDGGYVDTLGNAVALPALGDPRRVTSLDRDGEEVAVLIHDPAVLEDPGVIDAIAAGARLTADNARLQAEVRAQVAELNASRRRLLAAGDDERRRLERRLHDGAARRLTALRETLAEIHEPQVERAALQLEHAVLDLEELAAGLHPRELTERGLAAALASLAERSPVPVELSVPVERLAPELEATVFFVCSESLANVAKYADASRVDVSVRATAGGVVVEISDDGVGGARLGAGTGLRGLSDRVEALGGTLELDSPPGVGTHLVVTLPRWWSRP